MRKTLMRMTMLAALVLLASILFVVVWGRGPDEATVNPDVGASPVRVTLAWEALVGKWEPVAVEQTNGKKERYEGVEEYMTIKANPKTGHLAIIQWRSRDGEWEKLEIDSDGRPNLYWHHSEIVIPPLPPGSMPRVSGATILWAHPEVIKLPDGRGLIKEREPWLLEVDGDTLKMSQGYDAAGFWNPPEYAAIRKEGFGVTYFARRANASKLP